MKIFQQLDKRHLLLQWKGLSVFYFTHVQVSYWTMTGSRLVLMSPILCPWNLKLTNVPPSPPPSFSHPTVVNNKQAALLSRRGLSPPSQGHERHALTWHNSGQRQNSTIKSTEAKERAKRQAGVKEATSRGTKLWNTHVSAQHQVHIPLCRSTMCCLQEHLVNLYAQEP